MEITKKCTSCGQELPTSDFRKHPESKDKRKYECRACDDKRQAEYYLTYKETKKEHAKIWKAANKEKVREINKRYYQNKKNRGNDAEAL